MMDFALPTVDALSVALAVTGLVAAGIVKGATGLGYATCAIPFLVPAVGLPTAMALVIAPAVATNFGVIMGAGHLRETSRRFGYFYAATLPGIACGVGLLAAVNHEWATRFLGLSILLYALMALNQPTLMLPTNLAKWLQAPAGFATGVLTGLTGSQVMPLLPYMMSLGLDPNRLVQAINLSVLVCSSVLAATLLMAGTVPATLLVASLAALPLALAGVWLGSLCRSLISPQYFRTLMLVVLFGMGLSLAAR
jgi:uncharacterized protein